MGEYEPKDSRNVTGTASTPDGRWTGQQQQGGGQDSIGQQNDGVSDASNQQNDHTSGIGQEQQFQRTGSGQQGGMSGATGLADRIREHMEVVDQSGNHVGTVDHVRGEELVLTKSDSPSGEHRRIPLSQVDGVDSGRVRLISRGGA